MFQTRASGSSISIEPRKESQQIQSNWLNDSTFSFVVSFQPWISNGILQWSPVGCWFINLKWISWMPRKLIYILKSVKYEKDGNNEDGNNEMIELASTDE